MGAGESHRAGHLTRNADYRRQVVDVVNRLEGQRFLLPEDGVTLIAEALHTRVR
jgi:hypothetical protein